MSFNPDITKQAQEIIFSRKKNDTSHPSLYCNNARIQQQSVRKHLGLFSDEKTVGVNLMGKLNLLLSRSSFLLQSN